MLEDRKTRTVPRPIGCILADRCRSGGPVGTTLFVADVEHLGCRVQHRIVGPAGEAVALAVAIPAETGSGFAYHDPKGRVGDDVHPGCRGIGARAEIDYIFMTVLRETAETVEIVEFHER